MWLTALYGILIVVMLVGIVGAVVPGLPGPSLILGAIVVWCIATKFAVPLGFFAVIFEFCRANTYYSYYKTNTSGLACQVNP